MMERVAVTFHHGKSDPRAFAVALKKMLAVHLLAA